MIPPEAMTILATIGLTPDQAVQVAKAFSLIEEATFVYAATSAEGQRALATLDDRRRRDRERKRGLPIPRNSAELPRKDAESEEPCGTDPRVRGLCGADTTYPSVSLPPDDTNVSSAPKGAETRGKRLTADWKPNDDHRAEAKTLGVSDADLQHIVDEFRNYWETIPGAKGRKLDWDKTFTNRLRDQAPRYAKKRPQPDGQKTFVDNSGTLWSRN